VSRKIQLARLSIGTSSAARTASATVNISTNGAQVNAPMSSLRRQPLVAERRTHIQAEHMADHDRNTEAPRRPPARP
jgi:hypothetical protein